MTSIFNFRLKVEKRLMPLFLNESLRSVALSFLNFFSAVFIYKILLFQFGQQKTAILGVVAYFLGVYLFKFIGNLLAEELSHRSGLKKSVYAGELALALCLMTLYFSAQRPMLLSVASILNGLSAGFYWFGRHGLMAKFGIDGHYGRQLGTLDIIRTLFILIIPVTAGALISLAGYRAIFLVSLGFVFLSVLSLRKLGEEKTYRDTDFKEVFGLFKHLPKTTLAYLGNSGASTIYGLVFPLYLFLILKKELSLGGFFSLAMLFGVLVNFLVGRWVDFRGERGPIRTGSVISCLVWWGRFFSSIPASLLVLDVIDRITGGMTGISLSVLTYEKALDGHSTGRAVLFRESAITLGSILVGLLVLLMVFLGIELRYSFILAAFLSLLPLLLSAYERKKEQD